jgi:Tfp pilus assembly protein PilZ
MGEPAQPDKRQAPRISHSFMVRYRIPTAGKGVWLTSTLRDLSRGGARFRTDRAFAVGSTMDIQLLLPASPQPVALEARVAWAKAAALGTIELGVTFNPGDTGIQQVLDAAVTHFLRKTAGPSG